MLVFVCTALATSVAPASSVLPAGVILDECSAKMSLGCYHCAARPCSEPGPAGQAGQAVEFPPLSISRSLDIH
jgi:hypothetical protein